ncbi:hypothetical protein [Marinobacter qingdaonensis]|uniref:Phage lysis regulatory protein, LysB family n=1 Tax=Marinobacter qingdaonensis TaxID=3108486 RepID=A0ABU5NUP1_9GAMM|nr:hypothetical protein [Marinobacter sp. ASW11-75]MEA1079535.1 hypothetical protein [Marinobacter sp. ASW11-75]
MSWLIGKLLGPKVLLGIILSLVTALLIICLQLNLANSEAANASLNNKTLTESVNSKELALLRLRQERHDLEVLLMARDAEVTSGREQLEELRKELNDVENDACLDAAVPDAVAELLRDD